MEYLKIFMGTLWGIAIVCLLIYFYYLYIIVGGRVRFNYKTYKRFLEERVNDWFIYNEQGRLVYSYPIQHWQDPILCDLEKKTLNEMMDRRDNVEKFRLARTLTGHGYRLRVILKPGDLDN